MNNLIKMFPDDTNRGRKKFQVDNTPDDPDYTKQVFRDAIVVCAVIGLCVVLIAVVAYFGRINGW
jgi:hypothetical protein